MTCEYLHINRSTKTDRRDAGSSVVNVRVTNWQGLTKRYEGELEGLSAGDACVACGSQERVGGGAAVAHREQVLRGRTLSLSDSLIPRLSPFTFRQPHSQTLTFHFQTASFPDSHLSLSDSLIPRLSPFTFKDPCICVL